MLKTTRARLLAAAVAACVLAPAHAYAAEPAARFNAPGQVHAIVCVHLATSPASLRFTGGQATGFEVTDQLAFNDGRCPAGTVRLDHHEAVPSPAGPLVFHRGGNGYADEPNTKYGQLATPGIADALAAPVPSGGGRGAPCTLASEPPYRVAVASIPEAMHYKRPQDLPSGSNRGSSFEHYGDPGADQGDRHDIHYSYLLWSFVNVSGGGIVRTLLAPDQVVRACDVEPVTMDSWDRDGAVNGQVTARYVRILAGPCRLYGWMVWSHTHHPDAGGPVPHFGSAPAQPADPQPDPACPVAEPASPPTIGTGDAALDPNGTAVLGGTVDPEGAPTSYRFEYGPSPGYGSVTPDSPVSPRPGTYGVAARTVALQPGTLYHYRLVASNGHGAATGADRTLVTPPPPKPPKALRGDIAVQPVALGGLRVAPGAFKRSRSPRGAPARIRFTLSRPAKVTFTFLRGLPGVLTGSVCRRPPAGRLPRGGKRCVFWAPIGGSLRHDGAAGGGSARFAGWIGRRPLGPGRYRLRALAADTGTTGVPLLTGFRIR